MNQQGRLTTGIRDDRRRWPDSLSYGPNGYLYVCDSAIAHQMMQSKEHTKANVPYAIYRFKPGTESVAGQ